MGRATPYFAYELKSAWNGGAKLMNRGCWPTGVDGGTKPDQTAVVSWLAGEDASAIKSSAPWTFFDALETAYAHPPRVDAPPGAWPLSVGNGAEPTSVFAAAHGAAEFGAAQTVGYQFEPMAIAAQNGLNELYKLERAATV